MTRALLLAAILCSPSGTWAQMKAAAPVVEPSVAVPAMGGPASVPLLAPAVPSSSLPTPTLPTLKMPAVAEPAQGTARAKAHALPAAAIPGAAAAATAQPAPPGLAPVPALDGSVPAAQAAVAAGRAAPEQGGGLDASLRALERLFDGKRDEAAEGNSVVPEGERRRIAGGLRARFDAQLDAMEALAPRDKALLEVVRAEGRALLGEIETLMARGEIDPRADIRSSPDDKAPAVQGRELRVGVYPVAADPFQWAHLLIGLRAMAAFRLDKVVYVLAGDDPRKPSMTPVSFRHPMGQAVLDQFAPLFEYSAIAVGTTYDGETNIFQMLALNKRQRMKAFYLVGGDHYRLKDKNGGDDTLPKIEKRLKDAASGHDPVNHRVEAAFIAREGMDAHVPTSVEVHFLPNMSFDASSTLVRDGQHALMPHSAYDYVLKRSPGLYGIGAKED
ncbi:MAG: hypothetical protein HY928_01515 [Elusimicrobia bacterium]|nr:hypothetical protein [Elusimicrobiota bacterium]